MIKLIYDESVGLSDVSAAQQAITDIASLEKTEYRYGNDTYIREWQIGIVNGLIDHAQVIAIFPADAREYKFNEFGVMIETPPYQAWFIGDQCAALLNAQISKRKELHGR